MIWGGGSTVPVKHLSRLNMPRYMLCAARAYGVRYVAWALGQFILRRKVRTPAVTDLVEPELD